MKNKSILLGSAIFMHLLSMAQTRKDNLVTPSQTEIELVYNHYLQNGNNSAVTGGIGTERLTVYGPSLNLRKTAGKNTYSYTLGSDIVSSASTDNIDFVKSSASSLDPRTYMNGGYERAITNHLSINTNAGFSIESDYFSLSYGAGFLISDKNNNKNYAFNIAILNDDLRWGRINPGYYAPTKLIYPVELRFKEWYNDYKRNTYNFRFGFSQIINKRNTIGFFPEFTYQRGLLATPFHRIYFSDGSLAVENLPDKRVKGAIALKLNSFVGGQFIIKNTINLYKDNFGITALSYENETAVKITSALTVLPNFRLYTQSESDYFAPYLSHDKNEEFYTSDYDLSKFNSYNIGFGLKYFNEKTRKEKPVLNNFLLRYTFTHRTNELNAHSISLSFTTIHKK